MRLPLTIAIGCLTVLLIGFFIARSIKPSSPVKHAQIISSFIRHRVVPSDEKELEALVKEMDHIEALTPALRAKIFGAPSR
jgi:hypothetical protein